MNHESFATRIIEMINDVKKGKKTRELSLAVTKLEEAMHWIAADAIQTGADVGAEPDKQTAEELARILAAVGKKMEEKAEELLRDRK